ncbi:nuclear transport factor 2 family protein [Microbulbifer echini]|uniref:Nuclear transport factor 2 family protein n=1 Tax=Microbulbifer echini TaxID=1529067 RepID=A0ABV4NKI0_9GAMM|nr:nuclear transport factor 2 family protein [uncultured Microbulbifer sp.]
MDELQLFRDRFAISDLLSRYTLTIDNCDARGWASLFTLDGHFQHGSRVIRGREKLERYALIHNKLRCRHITSSPLHHLSEDGQSASGKATTVEINATRSGYRIAVIAEYRDELVKVDGNWLIRCRRGEEVKLVDDPDFPILFADPNTRDQVKLLMDAWDELGETVSD